MGRRELLTEDERTLLFGVPVDEAGLARHYTLTPDDLELLLAKRGGGIWKRSARLLIGTDVPRHPQHRPRLASPAPHARAPPYFDNHMVHWR
jgi:hypothetical protein